MRATRIDDFLTSVANAAVDADDPSLEQKIQRATLTITVSPRSA